MLDESDVRRPDFCGGTPIVLADGKPWFFPEVKAVRTMRVGPSGPEPVVAFLVGGDAAFGRNYEQRVLQSIGSRGEEAARHRLAALGLLLGRNYALPASFLLELLEGDPADPAGPLKRTFEPCIYAPAREAVRLGLTLPGPDTPPEAN